MKQPSTRDEEFELYQRQLALVDENLGLRAALAQEAVRNSPSRRELEDTRHEIMELRKSATWRVGKLVLTPVRVARRVLRRGER